MRTFEYLDPFAAGRIFLSHRCTDHDWSHRLARNLGKHFDIYYSCDGGMLLDGPVVPRQQLVASDLVLFLASPRSLDERSIARHELSIAEILNIKNKSALAMVRLENTKIPPEFSAFSFGRFRLSDATADAKSLTQALKRKLAHEAGLVARRFPKAHKGTIYFSQLNHSRLIETLHDYKGVRILPFNAPLQAFDMAELLRLIEEQPERRRGKIIENLLNIFHSTGDSAYNARQNAIFVLGKLLSGESGHARTLLKRMPDFDTPFLLRGYHIAMSFLPDVPLIDGYVSSLANDSASEWDAQRRVNRKFHIIYYNGVMGALTELRSTIATGKPRNLLGLNVFTLGDMSTYDRDVALLETYRSRLIHAGVAKQLIVSAIRNIRDKAK